MLRLVQAGDEAAETEVRPAIFPPGLVGDVAEFIYRAAPYPNATIALAGALGFLAGITGRAYNVNGTGLNLYVLVLAPTGAGKEGIADGISHLLAAVRKTVPAVDGFRGPGELVSAPGLFKWLDRLPNPAVFSLIGEFGLMLKLMAAPNASTSLAGLQRVLLQLYSKSGHGSVFDASAYSDKEKGTKAIASPSFTLIGEGVPESFYAALDETMIASGLLPRFLTFESMEPRPYQNLDRVTVPTAELTERVANLAAQALLLSNRSLTSDVAFDPAASRTFADFDRWTTDRINGSNAEATRQLWNRANLKALKLAAIAAVGRDPFNPVVEFDDCMWATTLIVDQTNNLIGRFERGETGAVGGSEDKQLAALVRCIAEYAADKSDPQRYAKYGLSFDMHRDRVFTQSFLSRRLLKVAAFRDDRNGATRALARAIQNLLDADDIRELPRRQMVERYGVQPRAFVVSNPRRFIETER